MQRALPAVITAAVLLAGCEHHEAAPPGCRPLSDHFCQEEFRQPDRSLRAIWGSSAKDIWAGGDLGELLHYDGTDWLTVASNTTQSIVSIWGSAPDDVWAVSRSSLDEGDLPSYDSTILHYDGRSWTPVWYGTNGHSERTRISGSGPTDIWVDGAPPMHYDGAEWTTVPRPAPAADCHFWVWAAADVWMGCTIKGGLSMAHFDGSRWTDFPVAGVAGHAGIAAIWGSASNDIWASPIWGGLLHYDGRSWAASVAAEYYHADAFWGTGPADLRGISRQQFIHYDGATWSNVSYYGTIMIGLWGSGPGDLWAVGEHGTIFHYDGVHFPVLVHRAPWANVSLTEMGGTTADDRWVAGAGSLPSILSVIGQYDGYAWSAQPLTAVGEPEVSSFLGTLWSSGPDDLWVGGGSNSKPLLLHRGPDWSVVPLPEATVGRISALWGSGPDDLWAAINTSTPVSSATLLHRTGGTWSALPAAPLTRVSLIWGSGPEDIWFGGLAASGGGFLHYDGKSLTYTHAPLGVELESLSGSGPGDVWATGGHTHMLSDFHLPLQFNEEHLLHYDGTDWKIAEEVNLHQRNAQVRATRRGDVWLLHEYLEHLEGGSWVRYDLKTTGLGRVWSADPRHVWFFGGRSIVRYLP